MNILVDSSAYSLALRHHPMAVRHFREATALYMSAIVLGELRYGFLKGTKREQNEAHLQAFLSQPRIRTVGIDEDTSLFYARIKRDTVAAGKTTAENDLWIAASAMQYGLCILTADKDFQHINQVMVELLKV